MMSSAGIGDANQNYFEPPDGRNEGNVITFSSAARRAMKKSILSLDVTSKNTNQRVSISPVGLF